MNGKDMFELCERLFPICRSITGNGFRESLRILGEEIPELITYEVPTGTPVFDWTVPKEWNIKDAYIKDSSGNKIVDFKESNLHVVGYSTPVNKTMDLTELKKILYTQPEQPDVVPYVTSYYKERYGFCVSQNQKDSLKEEQYQVFIDSELKDGSLTYGEVIIPGKTDQEIMFSTYLCHPSMANNELSGPAVATALIKWLKSKDKLKYTYRFVFIPETIGSITYLSRNLDYLKKHLIAGFVLSCVGDNRTYSYLPSRNGNTIADRVLRNVLKFHYPEYKAYSFLDRGSDERQYNSPGVDLPFCVLCRSKYGEYPEYHTSKDNLDLISAEGLEGALEVCMQCVDALEWNEFYQTNCLCEPQLGKRGLYPTISQKGSYDSILAMRDLIAYSDGTRDLLDISSTIKVPVKELIPIIEKLLKHNLLSIKE